MDDKDIASTLIGMKVRVQTKVWDREELMVREGVVTGMQLRIPQSPT